MIYKTRMVTADGGLEQILFPPIVLNVLLRFILHQTTSVLGGKMPQQDWPNTGIIKSGKTLVSSSLDRHITGHGPWQWSLIEYHVGADTLHRQWNVHGVFCRLSRSWYARRRNIYPQIGRWKCKRSEYDERDNDGLSQSIFESILKTLTKMCLRHQLCDHGLQGPPWTSDDFESISPNFADPGRRPDPNVRRVGQIESFKEILSVKILSAVCYLVPLSVSTTCTVLTSLL